MEGSWSVLNKGLSQQVCVQHLTLPVAVTPYLEGTTNGGRFSGWLTLEAGIASLKQWAWDGDKTWGWGAVEMQGCVGHWI